MQYFNFRAIDSAGAIQRGSIAANNAAEVDNRLSTRGLELIVCEPAHAHRFLRRTPVSRKQLIDFTFHLHQMVEAGVPLIDSLKEFRDSSDTQLRRSVGEIVEQVESGSSLSGACAMQPDVFKPVYTSMLQAGEQSGRLADVLADLLALLKWQDETLSSLRSVLIYPAFVCVVLAVVIGFVMAWLVPSLTSFITSAGAVLPWHTQWLITVSDFVVDQWLAALILVVTGVILVNGALRISDSMRYNWQSLQLKLPLIGSVLYKIKLARFCRCAALMYASGINLIDTLKHGESLVDSLPLSAALRGARESIIAGDTVADAFQQQSALPTLLNRLIRVGESTGAMDRAFLQTSYFYDRDSREAIERLEQFIGPVLIIFVGAIMMWVVLSVIGPIYDLVFSMQEAM